MGRRPQTRAKRRQTTTKAPKFITTKASIRASDETPLYYVNYAEIAMNAYEFSLYGGRVPTKPSPELIRVSKETGTISVDALFQMVFPVSLVDGLIEALNKQRTLHEAQFGPITKLKLGEET